LAPVVNYVSNYAGFVRAAKTLDGTARIETSLIAMPPLTRLSTRPFELDRGFNSEAFDVSQTKLTLELEGGL
jgi:hypothetical protein